jgi:hypothetical protein
MGYVDMNGTTIKTVKGKAFLVESSNCLRDLTRREHTIKRVKGVWRAEPDDLMLSNIANYLNFRAHKTPSQRPRDSQRSKLYDAERAFVFAAPAIATLADAQSFVDSIIPDVRVKSGCRTYCGRACPSRRYISIQSHNGHATNCTEGVLLHEIAHILAPRNTAWHGPQFAAIYLRLVKEHLGESAFRFLKWCFDLHGVSVDRRFTI